MAVIYFMSVKKNSNYTKKKNSKKLNALMISIIIVLILGIIFDQLLLSLILIILGLSTLKITDLILKNLRKHKDLNNIRSQGIEEIDVMGGIDFEIKLEILFRDLGYEVLRTPPSRDHKADLILTSPKGKTVVQIKRWKRPVHANVIKEVLEAKEYYQANYAMVVTNNVFTPTAKLRASKYNVDLMDRGKLLLLLNLSRKKDTRQSATHLHPKVIRIKT